MTMAIISTVVPGDTPTNLTVSSYSSSSVHLTWNQPMIPNGIIVSYTITYNLTVGQPSALVNVTSGTSYVVTGLDAFTYYEFVILASTRIGGGPSTTVYIRTEETSKLPSFIVPSDNIYNVGCYHHPFLAI